MAYVRGEKRDDGACPFCMPVAEAQAKTLGGLSSPASAFASNPALLTLLSLIRAF